MITAFLLFLNLCGVGAVAYFMRDAAQSAQVRKRRSHGLERRPLSHSSHCRIESAKSVRGNPRELVRFYLFTDTPTRQPTVSSHLCLLLWFANRTHN